MYFAIFWRISSASLKRSCVNSHRGLSGKTHQKEKNVIKGKAVTKANILQSLIAHTINDSDTSAKE